MEQILITEENFDNGVTLRLYDASRKLAGDRWLVCLAVCALVPVREEAQTGASTTFRQALGEQVVFERKRERHFIDEREKENVFNHLLENFRSMTHDYLAHPQFPARFVQKAFREYLAKERLRDQMKNRG